MMEKIISSAAMEYIGYPFDWDFDLIEHFHEKLGLEMTVLFKYALFLTNQKKQD